MTVYTLLFRQVFLCECVCVLSVCIRVFHLSKLNGVGQHICTSLFRIGFITSIFMNHVFLGNTLHTVLAPPAFASLFALFFETPVNVSNKVCVNIMGNN